MVARGKDVASPGREKRTGGGKRTRRATAAPVKVKPRGSTIGLESADPIEVSEQVKEGLPYRSLELLARESDIPRERLAEIAHIPKRTLVRRKQRGKLTRDESESVLRVGTLYEQAVELFEGDRAAAKRWLERPNRALAGRSPLELAETEIGGRVVEDLIGRLEHGVVT